MTNQMPNTSFGDISYWRLTGEQANHYLGRLTHLHEQQSDRLWARSDQDLSYAIQGLLILAALILTVGLVWMFF